MFLAAQLAGMKRMPGSGRRLEMSPVPDRAQIVMNP
jgi:hypothetical protein